MRFFISASVPQSTQGESSMVNRLLSACIATLLAAGTAAAQAPASGKRYRRLLIHNATVVDGNGTPASGPKDGAAISPSALLRRNSSARFVSLPTSRTVVMPQA